MPLSFQKLARTVGSPQRLKMLVALGQTEWLPASYLGRVAGLKPSAVSEHLRVLKKDGIVEQGMGRLYRLRSPWRGMLAEGWVDLGGVRVRARLPQVEDFPQGAAQAAVKAAGAPGPLAGTVQPSGGVSFTLSMGEPGPLRGSGGRP